MIKGISYLGFYNRNLTVKNRKQILILLAGILIAALLIISNLKFENWDSEITPASQKKPKQNVPALFEIIS